MAYDVMEHKMNRGVIVAVVGALFGGSLGAAGSQQATPVV